jgi:hypothetical protein
MKSTISNTTVSKAAKLTRQESFSRVAPILASALLMGAGVCFVLATVLATITFAGGSLYTILFGLSGPVGLALAICLAVNLWLAMWP